MLLASARAPSWRVNAIGLPFENKDYAKARGYRWNDGEFNTVRAWWIETRDERAELEFLQGIGCKNPEVIRQTALDRYRSLAAGADTEAGQATPERPANTL